MKKVASLLSALFFIAGASFGDQGMTAEQPEGVTLKYVLKAKETYGSGQTISVSFTLENVGEEKLWVLTWYTPLEGIKGRIFRVTCNGEEVPYLGRMIKRGNPSREDYVCIEPGQSIWSKVDLSLTYDLSKLGEYRVEFKGRIHDVTKEEDSLPRVQEKQRGMDIPGNTLTFRVIQP